MDPPVAIVLDMEHEVDLAHLPEHLRVATALSPSVITLYAAAYWDDAGCWVLDSVGAVTRYLGFPFPRLKALRVDVGFTKSRVEDVLADMLRPGCQWCHLQRLTVKLYQSPAFSVEDLLSALHGMPNVTRLCLDCPDWQDTSPDVAHPRAPPLSLQSFMTVNIFPGFDLLLRSLCNTLHTLIIGDPVLVAGKNYFHGALAPTRLLRLRNLVIDFLPASDIAVITSACPRLARLQVLHCAGSAALTEATLVPALEALQSPLKHLMLPHPVHQWRHCLPRLMDVFERPDSPLRALRSMCVSDAALQLTRTALNASPLSRRRIRQSVLGSLERSSLLSLEDV